MGWNTGRGGGFHSSCPRQLLSPPSFLHLAKQLDVALGAADPLSPTPPCLSQTLHNASSHSSSSACDRPGAAERALRVWERGFPGVEEGVLLCSLLTSSRGGGGFSWSWCQATPILQFNRPCGQCCFRNLEQGGRYSWGEPIGCSLFPGLREVQANGWMQEARELEQGLKVSERGKGRFPGLLLASFLLFPPW